LHQNWDLYDTRHAVFQPARMSTAILEQGYWQAYKDFYRWGSIFNSAWTKADWTGKLRHLGYAGGWKKFEPLWDWVIRFKQVGHMLPLLEAILTGSNKASSKVPSKITTGERLETAVTP
ncbi:MAG: B12-binding domain-containing radical SAM protein, partial [Anaerolineae bacterium]